MCRLSFLQKILPVKPPDESSVIEMEGLETTADQCSDESCDESSRVSSQKVVDGCAQT